MKRIVLAILTVAVCAGIFLPVTFSLSEKGTPVASQTIVFAQASVPGAPTTPGPTSNLNTAPTGLEKIAANAQDYNITSQFSCGTGLLGNGSLAGCLEWILYFIPFKVGAWLMEISAMLFDSLASLTLSSSLYSSSSFIADGWRVTRDFGNIFFILVLLLAALSLVLDIEIGHANPKKMIASVIFIALIVNFSFFITEAIIDTSNALALVFYNQITITNKSGEIVTNATNIPTGVIPPKNISAALVTAFQPQQIQEEWFWKNLEAPGKTQTTHVLAGCTAGAIVGTIVPVIGNAIGCTVGGLLGYFYQTTGSENKVPDSVIMGILVLTGIMFGVVAYSFFVASLSFLGRLIGLWIAIIFAPFAFVSYIMPSAQHLEGFGWTDWWKNLFTMAFAGPIYFFFLYLIALMTKSSFVSSTTMSSGSTKSAFAALIIMFISFMFFIVMLLKATTYVKKASGELGSMVFKGAALLGGAALGVAAGTGARLLSRTVGAKAKKKDTEDARDLAAGRTTTASVNALLNKYDKNSATHKRLAAMSPDEIAQTAEFQSLQRESARKLARWQKQASSSYDFRQTKAGKSFGDMTGVDMEGYGAFSTANSAGGYNGAEARAAAKQRAITDSFEANHAQIHALENAVGDRDAEETRLRSELAVARATAEGIDKVSDLAGWKAAKGKVEALEIELKNNTQGDKSKVWQAADVGKTTWASGRPVTTADVGKNKNTWEQTDVGIATKADGSKVSTADVQGHALKTESLSTADLKKAIERAKTDRAKSYIHQQMVQSAYYTSGQKYDNFGQLSQMGHMDFDNVDHAQSKEALRSWRDDAKRAFGIKFITGLGDKTGKEIGKEIVSGLRNVFGGDGALARMKAVFNDISNIGPLKPKKETNYLSTYTLGRMNARAISMASDLTHQIHEFVSKYKSPGSGFLKWIKGLGGSSGGDHAGGGDHHSTPASGAHH